jgi:hypothetical protein
MMIAMMMAMMAMMMAKSPINRWSQQVTATSNAHDLEGYDATWKVIKRENLKQRHPIRFGAIKIAIIPAVGAHCMRPPDATP